MSQATGWECTGKWMVLTCEEDCLQQAEVVLPVLLRDPNAMQGHGHVHLHRDRLRERHESTLVRIQMDIPSLGCIGGTLRQVP